MGCRTTTQINKSHSMKTSRNHKQDIIDQYTEYNQGQDITDHYTEYNQGQAHGKKSL